MTYDAVEELVAALVSGDQGIIVVTPAIEGAEGFGTTWTAAAAVERPEVRARFPDGITWLTADGAPEELIPEVFAEALPDGDLMEAWLRPFTDAVEREGEERAAHRLTEMAAAARRDRLIVIDGVRHQAVLGAAVAMGLLPVTIVLTTLLTPPGDDTLAVVRVPPLPPGDARALLAGGPHAFDEAAVGRAQGWPLLLTLMAALGAAPANGFDPADPAARAAAVHEVLERGLSFPETADRLLELGVLAGHGPLPHGIVAGLWQETAGMSAMDTELALAGMGALGLLAQAPDRDVLLVPEAVHAYARRALGPDGAARAARALIFGEIPESEPTSADFHYFLRHFPAHFEQAGEPVADLVCTGRWVAAKLEWYGLAAVERDLALAATPEAGRLRRTLAQNAHLFGGESRGGLTALATLAARLHLLPRIAQEVRGLLGGSGEDWLESRWAPPDLPHSALRRTLAGHDGHVNGVAVAPDGTWLATWGDDGTARLWNLDGTTRAVLDHDTLVTNGAIAPDGTWLATSGWDRTVRLWSADGAARRTLTGHESIVNDVVIAPDGSWLASIDNDGTLRTWTSEGAALRTCATGARRPVRLVVGLRGTWLAALSDDGVRILGADGTQRARIPLDVPPGFAITVHPSRDLLLLAGENRLSGWSPDGEQVFEIGSQEHFCGALALAPSDAWLAEASYDEVTLSVPGAAEGATMAAHDGEITGLAAAPDSSWLASAGHDGTARIWDVKGAPEPDEHYRRRHGTAIDAARDGSWLATAGIPGITFWDADGSSPETVCEDEHFAAVAISADSSRLAAADLDGGVWLLGRDRRVLWSRPSHRDAAAAVTIAPDGSWVASGGERRIEIWSAGGTLTTSWQAPAEIRHLAADPGGSWLAAAAWDRVWRWRPGGDRFGPALTAPAAIGGLAVAPDGSWLAAALDDGTVRMWDGHGTFMRDLDGEEADVTSLAIGPFGSWLATTDRAGTLRVWDVEKGRRTAAVRVDRPLDACAWTPGGTALYAVGAAGLYGFRLHVAR